MLLPNKTFSIDGKTIGGDYPTYFIADIAANHDGSLERAKDLIYLAKEAGADAAKFQHFKAETIVSDKGFKSLGSQSSHQASWKKSVFEIYKNASVSLEWSPILKETCKKADIAFFTSPYDFDLVNHIDEYVPAYKIGSGEVTNFLLLEKIISTRKPIILSSGMSSLSELDRTVSFLKSRNADFSILQCTTSYPTKPHQYGLNVIRELRNRYNIKVGYSDHSSEIGTCIAATALGAEILEFHVVFNKDIFGPDSKSSLTIDETMQLVKAVRDIKTALNNPVDKNDISNFRDVKDIFEKSLSINKDMKSGEVITKDDLEAKKPRGFGISASDYLKIIGMKVKNDIKKYSFINYKDIK